VWGVNNDKQKGERRRRKRRGGVGGGDGMSDMGNKDGLEEEEGGLKKWGRAGVKVNGGGGEGSRNVGERRR